MKQITLTLDFNAKNMTALTELAARLGLSEQMEDVAKVVNDKTVTQTLVDENAANEETPADSTPCEDKPSEKQAKPAKEPTKSPKPAAKPAVNTTTVVTMTDVRAVALPLSKAGKQTILAEILGKYNAKKLTDVAESDYVALLADLENANA